MRAASVLGFLIVISSVAVAAEPGELTAHCRACVRGVVCKGVLDKADLEMYDPAR